MTGLGRCLSLQWEDTPRKCRPRTLTVFHFLFLALLPPPLPCTLFIPSSLSPPLVLPLTQKALLVTSPFLSLSPCLSHPQLRTTTHHPRANLHSYLLLQSSLRLPRLSSPIVARAHAQTPYLPLMLMSSIAPQRVFIPSHHRHHLHPQKAQNHSPVPALTTTPPPRACPDCLPSSR